MANKENNYQDDQNKQKDAHSNDSVTTSESSEMKSSPQSLKEKVLASISENTVPIPNKNHQDEPLNHSTFDNNLTKEEGEVENTRSFPTLPPENALPSRANRQQYETGNHEQDPVVTPGNHYSQEETNVDNSHLTGQTNPIPTLQQESRRRKEKRQKENSLVTKIVIIVVLGLVIMLSILGFSFYRYWQDGLKPLDPNNRKLAQVEIPLGTSNKGIAAILEKDKIIKSGLVFTYFVKTNNLTDFQAGYYQMSPSMELEEIGLMLQQGGTAEPEALADAQITVIEGYSIDQIVSLIVDKTNFSKEEVYEVIEDDAFFNELLKAYPDLLGSVKDAKDVRYRLEGYLFPATYNYYKDISLKELITQMVNKTNEVLKPRYGDIKAQKFTVQEVLTLASLVEKEGSEEEDRRNIAQVFFNRLEIDMPLQSDISILYAMDEHKVHLSNKDTQVDSPYNLYIHTGFGPGPFNSPSEQAIDAVLNPLENDYLYFLADVTTTKVYFAKDYDEHLRLKEKYIDNLQ